MKFELRNEKVKHYREDFKPFQASTVVSSASGFEGGFSLPFLALFDIGAKNTSLSSKRMEDVLEKVRDKNGRSLEPVGTSKSIGVFGKEQLTSLYILPHLYVGSIHLEDVLVSVLKTENFDCLIGRSILHQCVSTYDPDEDMMYFDFKESLYSDKQKIGGYHTFGTVHTFAEFGQPLNETENIEYTPFTRSSRFS